ncbi:uncharacterized protein OCT59_017029 [Rhizophagus irregularis]|nr:hypothetical protein RirG_122580 [Rhizophagus irregularis DAOM 197198w]UZO24735.1 hypothetical protein OCT59_017029 [Rhizophagus irregularis]GBC14680.2 hypothetical protein GLOIN_2v1828111 [Rhizophagus irregularis DAOM 181602=DAOM 197198]CAG8538975.1 22721_t:CDS:1 [Rhizophagus irregularis]
MPSPMYQSMNDVPILSSCKFFHHTPDDDSFYHVNCEIISHDTSFDDHHNYDHEFFYYSDIRANYHVKCKLLSHTYVVKLLNGIDPDINDIKPGYLSPIQKLNLEQSLRQTLFFYIPQHSNLEREYSDKNINGHYVTIKSTADIQNNVDNSSSHNDHVANEVEEYPQQHDFDNISNQTNSIEVSIIDSQENFNNHQNGEGFQQHQILEDDRYSIESFDHLQYHVSEREPDYDSNINRNIVNDVTQASTMIDNSNFLSCNDNQNVYVQPVVTVQFLPYQVVSDQIYNNDCFISA